MPACSRKGCGLPQDEGGLCFAHKSAALIDTIAEVMTRRKVVMASAGGVSITLHPEAFLDYERGALDEKAAGDKREADAIEPPKEEKPGRGPKRHRPIGLREEMNGIPVSEEALFGAAEGNTGLPD